MSRELHYFKLIQVPNTFSDMRLRKLKYIRSENKCINKAHTLAVESHRQMPLQNTKSKAKDCRHLPLRLPEEQLKVPVVSGK